MAERLLAHMTLPQKIAQIFMVNVDGTQPGAQLRQFVHDWTVGGLILYRANVVSAQQVRALLTAAQSAAQTPLLVATDQEGGRISMIPPWAGVPAMLAPSQYGYIDSAERVYRDAYATGHDLHALGVNMDLAPVLDVLIDPYSPIGSRSFGRDPALVARLGTAAIRGYQDAGIAATAKHFLGLGGVSIDAHRGLPTVARSMVQLNAVELPPMQAAIKAGVDALMVTHAGIPALDPSDTPASLSRPIIDGFIRQRLGYGGLIISDSLMMGAITGHMSVSDAAVKAIAAGNDIVLISGSSHLTTLVRRSLDAVEHAVATGAISTATIDDAVRHVLLLKARLGLLPSPASSHHST
jgi:beta-N-acetylhexosaminidase